MGKREKERAEEKKTVRTEWDCGVMGGASSHWEELSENRDTGLS